MRSRVTCTLSNALYFILERRKKHCKIDKDDTLFSKWLMFVRRFILKSLSKKIVEGIRMLRRMVLRRTVSQTFRDVCGKLESMRLCFANVMHFIPHAGYCRCSPWLTDCCSVLKFSFYPPQSKQEEWTVVSVNSFYFYSTEC